MKPKLKEINGKYYQEAEVVILATEGKSRIHFASPFRKNELHLYQYHKELIQGKSYKNQHLYIVSNEDIKDDDYFLYDKRLVVKAIRYLNGRYYSDSSSELYIEELCEKIIATTDTSLFFKKEGKNYMGSYMSFSLGENLPKPSQNFIKKFIEEYNKGNIITNVLVQVKENDTLGVDPAYYPDEPQVLVKVDSNNCIIIKKLEAKLYSIEEIFDAIDESIKECILYANFKGEYHPSYTIEYSKKLLEQKLNNI